MKRYTIEITDRERLVIIFALTSIDMGMAAVIAEQVTARLEALDARPPHAA